MKVDAMQKRLSPRSADADAMPPVHPGEHVREVVLKPKKMSVTQAADIVGVSRPALSNFLNCKVAATPDMATRIERAFGLPAQTLLDMQAAFEAAKAKSKGAPTSARAYVPPFLSIKANDIESWATKNIVARTRLSVFLRTLVNSTALGLVKVDFPGNDDAERAGWDGYTDTMEATQWVPAGPAGWEFGVTANVKGKADGDFAKSVKAIASSERKKTTFVFVTPRRWHGKSDWILENKAKNLWKDVRAYDSSDLEQWIEQSIAGQSWFANETHQPSEGVRSLDKCWLDWAQVTNPPLSASLFNSAIEAAKRVISPQLSQAAKNTIVIASDSVGEALAFLAQIFKEGGELAEYRDRVLVFDKPGILPQLASGSRNFIPVATSALVEQEVASLASSMHTIVIHPRNAANSEPDIVLEPINGEAFRSALGEMGYDTDHIEKYDNESGRSLTVLRRRLSTNAAIKTPQWASDASIAASLIPFLFAGSWNSTNKNDQTVLALLANTKSYETLEKTLQLRAQLEDAPVWSVASYRGAVSKIDLLFAIANVITAPDLKRFFDVATIVLGEDDPKLDLPEKDQWAAALYGKSRELSSVLRQGVSETLVLLAIHGNYLFQRRLGFNCQAYAENLIQELLTPLSIRTLEANDRDLPTYAEVAPERFLSIIEKDLQAPNPATMGLMKPVSADIFGATCRRTGLLWALENLAWNPDTLPRVVLILGRLAEIEIKDNWLNKPIHSLESIFRAWMPQTAANHDLRLAAIKLLAREFPKVAWKICVEQFSSAHRTGHYNHKPRWRTDAYGFGEPFPTWGPIIEFQREMVSMALEWRTYTREMLCDLIERLPDIDEEYQKAVWEIVRSWANKHATDTDKAWIREKIRVTVMSRRSARRTQHSAELIAAAKAAYEAIEPTDLLNKHEWLFRQAWVDESADDLNNDKLDYRSREERISKRRAEALKEIYAARGAEGVIELANLGNTAVQIGWLMATRVLSGKAILEFVLKSLFSDSNEEQKRKKDLVRGVLHSFPNDTQRVELLDRLASRLAPERYTELLLLAPSRRSTWQKVDSLPDVCRDTYWSEVAPDWLHEDEQELNEAAERLLKARRPRAAFICAQNSIEKVRSELLFAILSEIAKGGKEQDSQHQLDQYHIEQAFSHLNKDPLIGVEQKAGLEFAYIDLLTRPPNEVDAYGIPNLERYVETHPELFVQAITWVYKRSDEGDDPDGYKVAVNEAKHLAERGYRLLEGMKQIPGLDDPEFARGKLGKWVYTVREACADLGRVEIGDTCIGKLLSNAPVGEDAIWPCEPVRDILEELRSEKMAVGVCSGLYNSRGVHWGGSGGDQERALADRYRPWANAIQYSHPFVSSGILMEMVKTYEDEASRADTEVGLRRRLRH